MNCNTCDHARRAKKDGFIGCMEWSRDPRKTPEFLEAYMGWTYVHLGPGGTPDTATSHLVAPEHVVVKEGQVCHMHSALETRRLAR